jgi:hypothetical protein
MSPSKSQPGQRATFHRPENRSRQTTISLKRPQPDRPDHRAPADDPKGATEKHLVLTRTPSSIKPLVLEMHQLKDEPYDPSDDGFVFSDADSTPTSTKTTSPNEPTNTAKKRPNKPKKCRAKRGPLCPQPTNLSTVQNASTVDRAVCPLFAHPCRRLQA